MPNSSKKPLRKSSWPLLDTIYLFMSDVKLSDMTQEEYDELIASMWGKEELEKRRYGREVAPFINTSIAEKSVSIMSKFKEKAAKLGLSDLMQRLDSPTYGYADSHKDDLPQMLHCCADELIKMTETGDAPAPFYFWRVAILAAKQKQYDLEVAICEILIESYKLCIAAYKEFGFKPPPTVVYNTRYLQIKERLPKAKGKKQAVLKKSSVEAVKDNIPKVKKSPAQQLRDQCEKYGIPLEKISLEWDSQNKRYLKSKEKAVEFAVKHYLLDSGRYDLIVPHEGHSLLIMIQAACLPMLREAARHMYEEDYCARTFTTQLQMYKLNQRTLKKQILSCSVADIGDGINEILLNESVRKWLPGLCHSHNDIIKLYKALDKKIFAEIVNMILNKPSVYGSGWFDLICLKDGVLSFIETKTTDILRDTQITFIEDIGKPLGLEMKVIQVEKAKPA